MEKTLILKHISRMLCLLISYSKFTRTDKNKVLTNVRERNKIQTVKDIKAVKRRVGEEIRRRESRQVGRDMEGFFEHGLGALHRLRIRTGYPADADRLQREYPLSYLTIDERLFIRSCRGLIP